jgi:hypothetical protein
MSESKNKNLVGQPIFKQFISLVNKNDFNGLVKKYEADRYYKKFTTWPHFVIMMFGIYCRHDSVIEIVESMIGCVGKLDHFGLLEIPPKSTITDGNPRRERKFFELLYLDFINIY